MIEFFVEGKPVGKERARKGKSGKFYTPPKTKAYEFLVALKANQACRLKRIPEPTKSLVNVDIIIYGKSRADGDNVVKSILDGMQGIVYLNDKQVISHSCKRINHPDILPKTWIKVTHA